MTEDEEYFENIGAEGDDGTEKNEQHVKEEVSKKEDESHSSAVIRETMRRKSRGYGGGIS